MLLDRLLTKLFLVKSCAEIIAPGASCLILEPYCPQEEDLWAGCQLSFQNPLSVKLPNFVTSYFYPLATLKQNFIKIASPGSYFIFSYFFYFVVIFQKDNMKNLTHENFSFSVKSVRYVRGNNIGLMEIFCNED